MLTLLILNICSNYDFKAIAFRNGVVWDIYLQAKERECKLLSRIIPEKSSVGFTRIILGKPQFPGLLDPRKRPGEVGLTDLYIFGLTPLMVTYKYDGEGKLFIANTTSP